MNRRIAKRLEFVNSTKVSGLKIRCARAWKQLRNGFIGLFAVMLMTLLNTACDAHRDAPDTSMKIGHVVCTDGKVLPYEDVASLGKTPIAVVFHINNYSDVPGQGYAVYLNDLPYEYALTDSIGVVQGTNTNIYAHAGNANTYALLSNSSVISPAANAVYDMWRYGQSAYIPSVAELRLLYQAKDVINPILVACGGEPLSDNPDKGWLWSSTEVEGQATHKAWLYSIASGAMQETPKDQRHKIRPIITLNE